LKPGLLSARVKILIGLVIAFVTVWTHTSAGPNSDSTFPPLTLSSDNARRRLLPFLDTDKVFTVDLTSANTYK
jgi:hypothetical protein